MFKAHIGVDTGPNVVVSPSGPVLADCSNVPELSPSLAFVLFEVLFVEVLLELLASNSYGTSVVTTSGSGGEMVDIDLSS